MLRRIYSASFFFSVGLALAAYVNSSFLNSFFSEKFVGIIYAAGALMTLFFLSEMTPALTRLGNRRLMLSVVTLNIAALFSFTFLQTPVPIALAFIIYMVTNNIIVYCFDVFVEHYSDNSTTGRTRGLYLTIVNAGWVLAPITASIILTNMGFNGIYGLAIGSIALVFLIIYKKLYTYVDRPYARFSFKKTIHSIKDHQPLQSVTVINFLLQFFYAWMVIYSPIYLFQEIGLSWEEIGLVFSIMLTAFVIFQYPLGRYADKKSSEKELLTLGLIIAGLATIAMSIIITDRVIIWAIVFFMSRVGASIIESMSEIHFFKETKNADASVLSIFRDMNPLAYLIAPLSGSLLLVFIPFNYLFLILGVMMLAGTYYSMHLEKNNHLWKKAHTPSGSTNI